MHSSLVTPDMTLLDVVSRFRATEDVFRSYDEHAGVCLLCKHLFDDLESICARYSIDLREMLEKLEYAANTSASNS